MFQLPMSTRFSEVLLLIELKFSSQHYTAWLNTDYDVNHFGGNIDKTYWLGMGTVSASMQWDDGTDVDYWGNLGSFVFHFLNMIPDSTADIGDCVAANAVDSSNWQDVNCTDVYTTVCSQVVRKLYLNYFSLFLRLDVMQNRAKTVERARQQTVPLMNTSALVQQRTPVLTARH